MAVSTPHYALYEFTDTHRRCRCFRSSIHHAVVANAHTRLPQRSPAAVFSSAATILGWIGAGGRSWWFGFSSNSASSKSVLAGDWPANASAGLDELIAICRQTPRAAGSTILSRPLPTSVYDWDFGLHTYHTIFGWRDGTAAIEQKEYPVMWTIVRCRHSQCTDCDKFPLIMRQLCYYFSRQNECGESKTWQISR